MLPQPTQKAFSTAAELGAAMARLDRQVQPLLATAHTYSSFVQFMCAHRLILEYTPAFARWENMLVQFIESEERATGLPDEVAAWNAVNTGISVPLRCAFWYSWEVAIHLKQRFDECQREARERESETHLFRVAGNSAESPAREA